MNAAPDIEPAPTSQSSEPTRKQRKKVALIDRFIRSLDALAFAQISVLYYFDNSTFLLLLRVLSQVLFVSPGSGPLLSAPQLPPVLVANVFGIVSHLLQDLPTADTGSRGYLHGGVLLDFVGQKSVTIWTLLALDIFIFGIQVLMLIAALLKYKDGETGSGLTITRPSQDLDAEEAGLLRPHAHDNEDGIELNDLSGNRETDQPGDWLHNSNAAGESVLEFNIVEGIQALLRSRTVAPPMEDVSSGLLGNLITRLAAARSQTASAD